MSDPLNSYDLIIIKDLISEITTMLEDTGYDVDVRVNSDGTCLGSIVLRDNEYQFYPGLWV